MENSDLSVWYKECRAKFVREIGERVDLYTSRNDSSHSKRLLLPAITGALTVLRYQKAWAWPCRQAAMISDLGPN